MSRGKEWWFQYKEPEDVCKSHALKEYQSQMLGKKKSPKFIINQGVLVNKAFTRTKSFGNKATGKTRTRISIESGEQ